MASLAEEEVEIVNSDSSYDEPQIDRRETLGPFVTRVVEAIGGFENGVYRMGDEVGGCLRDLKKLWRKDDTDDNRTVARLLSESRVLMNDLIPILLCTAGKGLVEDKRAIACADMITAMTWPIDVAQELKELDNAFDEGADYTQLIQSHLAYKSALLKSGVFQALLGIMLAPLAKPVKERQERDGQVINVVLHLIRNLAFIKDLPVNSHSSADQAEYSSLQTKYIKCLADSQIFQLLLTIASNTHDDPLFNGWNTLVLEIFYLLFRGVKPALLATDQAKQSSKQLHSLLAAEQRSKQEVSRKASSRHSRFGTTISVSLNTNKKRPETENEGDGDAKDTIHDNPFLVLHRQSALTHESGSIMDLSKKTATKKAKTSDELTREENLSIEAKTILQNLAIEILDACFNPFLAGLLKDIRSERPKITDKDNLRLLYITKWFLEFFLAMRARAKLTGQEARWNFGLIAEVTERTWIIWVLKRMREAVEEKPKLWTELQAGIECLTQLLLLIDTMSSSEISDPALRDAAEVLQQQLIYNGEILDIAFESLRSYKEGTQSLVYLNSSVHLTYALLRMLEKWGKGDGVYVRKKTKKRRTNGGDEDMDEPEAARPDNQEMITEALFSFEAFQMKFAHADITHTLLTYLARYKEFATSESMRRVVNLMHRQAVKSKAEGLYFKASTLQLFKTILDDQKNLPREQPYKDLLSLINFVLRQFFKAMTSDSFLAIEAFFPKNRGNWKQFSSWEPEVKEKRARGGAAASEGKFPADVQVKKGFTWSEELGIAIACLVDDEKRELVEWAVSILETAISDRKRIVEETDNPEGEERPSLLRDDNADDKFFKSGGPSSEALSKIQDHLVTYTGEQSDSHAHAATRNPHLKLLFRLCKMYIMDDDAEELEWYIPSGILISDLESCRVVINQYLDDPIDLDGKKASQCLSKKRQSRRRRRSPSPDSDADTEHRPSDDEDDNDETRAARKEKKEKRKKEKSEKKVKKAKKVKEQEKYKSAQFIEDSEDEFVEGHEGWEAFLAQEAEKRKGKHVESGTGTMRATGTKKRRRKGENGVDRKRRKGSTEGGGVEQEDEGAHDQNAEAEDAEPAAESSEDEPEPAPRPKPRPRPKPKPRKQVSSPTSSHAGSQLGSPIQAAPE